MTLGWAPGALAHGGAEWTPAGSPPALVPGAPCPAWPACSWGLSRAGFWPLASTCRVRQPWLLVPLLPPHLGLHRPEGGGDTLPVPLGRAVSTFTGPLPAGLQDRSAPERCPSGVSAM